MDLVQKISLTITIAYMLKNGIGPHYVERFVVKRKLSTTISHHLYSRIPGLELVMGLDPESGEMLRMWKVLLDEVVRRCILLIRITDIKHESRIKMSTH